MSVAMILTELLISKKDEIMIDNKLKCNKFLIEKIIEEKMIIKVQTLIAHIPEFLIESTK